MKLVKSYLLIILSLCGLSKASDEFIIEPGEEVIVDFELEAETGDKLLVEIDNFTMFLPESVFLTIDSDLNLIAEDYGVFSATISDNFKNTARLNGLVLFGNSDSANVRVSKIKGSDTTNVYDFTLLTGDTSQRNNYLRFGFIDKIYPIPANAGRVISVEILSDYEDKLDIEVIDISGKMVYKSYDYLIQAGKNLFDVALPLAMPNGRYKLFVNGSNQSYYGEIVVIN